MKLKLISCVIATMGLGLATSGIAQARSSLYASPNPSHTYNTPTSPSGAQLYKDKYEGYKDHPMPARPQ